jgi:hypothetical protein
MRSELTMAVAEKNGLLQINNDIGTDVSIKKEIDEYNMQGFHAKSNVL